MVGEVEEADRIAPHAAPEVVIAADEAVDPEMAASVVRAEIPAAVMRRSESRASNLDRPGVHSEKANNQGKGKANSRGKSKVSKHSRGKANNHSKGKANNHDKQIRPNAKIETPTHVRPGHRKERTAVITEAIHAASNNKIGKIMHESHGKTGKILPRMFTMITATGAVMVAVNSTGDLLLV